MKDTQQQDKASLEQDIRKLREEGQAAKAKFEEADKNIWAEIKCLRNSIN